MIKKVIKYFIIQPVYSQTGVAKPDKIENTDFKLALNNAAHNEVLSGMKLHLFLIYIILSKKIRVEL